MHTADLEGWELVGHIGVDAGLCWIGDPCYIMSENTPFPTWDDFLESLWEEGTNVNHRSFEYSHGQEGLGVAVSTGFGDGVYPVYVKWSNEGPWGRRIAEAKVVFVDCERCEVCEEPIVECDCDRCESCDDVILGSSDDLCDRCRADMPDDEDE